ncbi:hypothetical protein BN7_4740 [Wickerhamomyces ciferrii]|uniref:Uncharacterized protein n=1 Tax=Wickerhamomyces ciferrii (strain ATCC 14091 / BCRC 22168 / CBS 111 / JCM 3599 / NBRC 0793 / NRRL Y-1031 F-60-10) TaxID=1206466 RepID=K0KQ39_WICCF|nr:uncharacterized protein BN7_4740 [Wickerhamomyces ciferrii]CCH45161.1 hypothetical protein BN7_4740 [Wickerhamomyces ciferrii]
MFSRSFSPFIRRNLSFQTAPKGTRSISASSIVKKFDKSMLYPTMLVVLLGSQIMNVMNIQTSCEDMERRYDLKISKIDELIERISKGEKIDVQKEMELVNKSFERKANKINLRSTSDKIGRQFGKTNTNTKDLEFDDDLKIDDELTDEQLNKLFSFDSDPTKIHEKVTHSNSNNNSKDSIKTLTDEELKQQIQNEKDLLNYKLSPDRHVLVENPGDYVEAAKDTKVSGFL